MISTSQPFLSMIGLYFGLVTSITEVVFDSLPKSPSIITSPSHAGSAKCLLTPRKSIITNENLFAFSTIRVPRPIICLNCVIEEMFLSMAINFTVFVSTPVDKSSDVVAITG